MTLTTSKIDGVSIKIESASPEQGEKLMRNFAKSMGQKKFKIKQVTYCPVIWQLQQKINKQVGG